MQKRPLQVIKESGEVVAPVRHPAKCAECVVLCSSRSKSESHLLTNLIIDLNYPMAFRHGCKQGVMWREYCKRLM